MNFEKQLDEVLNFTCLITEDPNGSGYTDKLSQIVLDFYGLFHAARVRSDREGALIDLSMLKKFVQSESPTIILAMATYLYSVDQHSHLGYNPRGPKDEISMALNQLGRSNPSYHKYINLVPDILNRLYNAPNPNDQIIKDLNAIYKNGSIASFDNLIHMCHLHDYFISDNPKFKEAINFKNKHINPYDYFRRMSSVARLIAAQLLYTGD